MAASLPEGYQLRTGSERDRSLIVKFLQRTYADLFPGGNSAHLQKTVDQYFSEETPVWWVEQAEIQMELPSSRVKPVGCLWMGNAIDQITGSRHAHIFLLYVMPEHRRCGIGSALVRYAEAWAKARGDRQIGLQVFAANLPALTLYRTLGYETQALWMSKSLESEP